VGRGYRVLSLAYFKEPGLPESLEEIPLEYFETAFNWLSRQPGIIPDAYGLIGGSKGAELALVLASRFQHVNCVVAWSPSSVVWPGIPKNRFDLTNHGKSSWSFQGQGLPFLPVTFTRSDWWSLLTLRLRDKSEEALKDETAVDAAAIRVENCRCPILLLSGERDRVWPTTLMSEQIVGRLASKVYTYAYEHVAFNTGHTWLVRNQQGWRSAFDFMDRHFIASSAAE
jgi:dienelactone hydrolase